ncbi:MMPL family transporter [Paralimibaculum aggregatum]|uniref:MMPL family transporter n=1 Tax=Paralimibaculum aggregatum TaxID=3036245 RepID=A0ABQ6LJC7_9RHOB|nr:MMPL family transporter [Limibaculum sp. NKW23]GMG81298.1 MMPL family transporter [Limibaculum sp. NKW23]
MRSDWATEAAGRACAGWIAAAAGRPRAVLAALGLLLAAAVWAASGLRVDTDSSRMLAPELPFQARAQALNAAFPELKNTIVVAVRGPRADPVEAALTALAARLEGDPSVASVFAPSIDPFFRTHGLLYLDEAAFEAQLTRLSKSANMLARLREDQSLPGFLRAVDEARALAAAAEGFDAGALDRLYAEAAAVIAAAAEGEARSFDWTGLFGDAGPVLRVLTLTPRLDYAALNPARAAMQAAAAAVAALPPEITAEVEIGLTGDPVLRAEELRSVTATIGLSLAISVLLVALVLWLALGSLARMGLALGALLVTLVLTTGAAALAVGALNLVSVAFIVLMVGLGIDFAIHLMAHLEEDLAAEPLPGALRACGRRLGGALALTAATTAAAFLAFAGTDFIGMAQLGLIGAMGVVIAFLVAITLLPAAVALRPRLAAAPRRRAVPALPPMPRLGRLGAGLAAALGLAALLLVPQARFDADPMSLRNPEARSVAVYGWLAADPLRAPLRLSLLTETAKQASAAARALKPVVEVDGTTWLGDLVPKDQDAKLALFDIAWPSIDFAVNGEPVALAEPGSGDPAALAAALGAEGAAGRLAAALAALGAAPEPATRARVEAALFRHFPALIGRLEAQLGADRVTLESLPPALAARYLAADGRYRVEIRAAADISDPAARARFVEAVQRVAPEAGGPPDQIEGAARAVAGAMLQAVLVALAATAGLVLLAAGRVWPLVAILVPVALAGAVTAAATVLLDMPFNYANVIVLPLLIGLGVDAGVHLALRTERSAAVYATSTPRAVLASALTTIGAFATLALSDHRGTASMGVLLAIAVGAAVAMALALSPPLARLGARARGRARSRVAPAPPQPDPNEGDRR